MLSIDAVIAFLTTHVAWSATMFWLVVVAYVAVLLKWHVSEGPFDFRAALLEPPTVGSVSLSRLGQLTALVVSTDTVLYYAAEAKLTEWMFAAYMTAWAGTYIASKFAPQQKQGEAQPKPDVLKAD